MGFHAKWTTTCDSCSQQVVKELTPEQDDTNYMDIWGPGFPDNWFQRGLDGSIYCSIACLQAPLRSEDKHDEAAALDSSVWIA